MNPLKEIRFATEEIIVAEAIQLSQSHVGLFMVALKRGLPFDILEYFILL